MTNVFVLKFASPLPPYPNTFFFCFVLSALRSEKQKKRGIEIKLKNLISCDNGMPITIK